MINLANVKRYIIFLFGGGLGLLSAMVLTFVLTEYFYLDHMISYSFGLLAALLVNFNYHTKITFKYMHANIKTITKFTMIFLFITLINWFLVFLFTKQIILLEFRYYYLIVIFFVTLCVSVINFLINKLWVFRS